MSAVNFPNMPCKIFKNKHIIKHYQEGLTKMSSYSLEAFLELSEFIEWKKNILQFVFLKHQTSNTSNKKNFARFSDFIKFLVVYFFENFAECSLKRFFIFYEHVLNFSSSMFLCKKKILILKVPQINLKTKHFLISNRLLYRMW